MKYGKLYQSIAEKLLARSITVDDGIDLSAIESVERELNIKIPAALLEYYKAIGKISEIDDGHNHFIAPRRDNSNENVFVFLEENQGVCYWGFDINSTDKDNPEVLTKLSNDESEWTWTNLRLHDFIIENIYLQLAWGGFEYSSRLDSGIDRVIEIVDRTWEKVVDRDELRIWYKDGMLISYLEGADELMGAARAESGFERMEKEFGFETLH